MILWLRIKKSAPINMKLDQNELLKLEDLAKIVIFLKKHFGPVSVLLEQSLEMRL